MLLCRDFGLAINYALFGVTFLSLKFGWCKETDVLQICGHEEWGIANGWSSPSAVVVKLLLSIRPKKKLIITYLVCIRGVWNYAGGVSIWKVCHRQGYPIYILCNIK